VTHPAFDANPVAGLWGLQAGRPGTVDGALQGFLAGERLVADPRRDRNTLKNEGFTGKHALETRAGGLDLDRVVRSHANGFHRR
jgi:hypothetical protein